MPCIGSACAAAAKSASAAVSPNLRHVYIVIRYGKQPLYAHFIAYRPSSTWQVIHVTWNTDPSQVFPESLLIPRG